jgi:hypothetical protein
VAFYQDSFIWRLIAFLFFLRCLVELDAILNIVDGVFKMPAILCMAYYGTNVNYFITINFMFTQRDWIYCALYILHFFFFKKLNNSSLISRASWPVNWRNCLLIEFHRQTCGHFIPLPIFPRHCGQPVHRVTIYFDGSLKRN